MGVCTTETKAAYGGASRRSCKRFPRFQIGIDIERRIFKIKMFIGSLEIQCRRQFFMLKRQQYLLHTRHTGRRRSMADICFYGTDRTIVLLAASLFEHGRQRL